MSAEAFATPINPAALFSEAILQYKVKTKKLGPVRYVNLDNAATTPPFQEVERMVSDYLVSYGSVHRGAGAKSKLSTDIYEVSREIIKECVNAPSDDYVLFCGNTTGGINTAAYFFSFLAGKIMVSTVEHSSSWLPWIKSEGIKLLGSQQYELGEMARVNERIQELGREQIILYDVNEKFEFDLHDIERQLKEHKVKLVVLTASSNVTGYCPDIQAVGRLAHQYGAYFLVDGCQFLQHHKMDMQKMGIDFLVASGHKFYAPYGGGFLIGPKKFLDEMLPYQIGGGNLPYIAAQGKFLRYKSQMAHDPGTPNATGVVAMMSAMEKLRELGFDNIEAYEKKLALKLFDYLRSNPKVKVYVDRTQLNTVLPFTIQGYAPAAVAERLNEDYGIGVRAGSFCAYQAVRKLLHITDESEVIKLLQHAVTTSRQVTIKNHQPRVCRYEELVDANAKDTAKIPALVRASIGLCNTEEDIDRMIAAIAEITG